MKNRDSLLTQLGPFAVDPDSDAQDHTIPSQDDWWSPIFKKKIVPYCPHALFCELYFLGLELLPTSAIWVCSNAELLHVILEWVSLLPTFQLERVAPACLYRHQCSFDKNKQMCVRHVGLALLVYWWKLRFLYGYNCLDSVWSIARPACTVLQMRVEKTSL